MDAHDFEESDAERMERSEIDELLEREGIGVLSLADGGTPYSIPMSFGYDGERLYFVYLRFGAESRKERLSERAGRASFVCYRVQSRREWRSVAVSGPIGVVPASETGAMREAIEDNGWHPSLFASAVPVRGIEGYALEVEEATGVKSADWPVGD